MSYTYAAPDRRISKSVDETGDGSIDFSEHFVYDGSDIVYVFRDTDGSGPAAVALDSRLLHGPAVDQIFADEDAVGEVLWSLILME